MNAATLCTRDVATCGPDETIVDAAARMRSLHTGDLVVVRGNDGACIPVGLLTDRDIVLAVVSAQADPAALFVRDLMSSPAVLAHRDDDIWRLVRRMRQYGVRRLPVVGNDGNLMGIVALDDLLRAAAGLLDELGLVASRQLHFEAKQRPARMTGN